LKFARHDEVTLGAAVRGFCEHFELTPVNVIDVLPPWHVSGLMARVRCAVTGGRYLAWQWKMLEAGEWPELSGEEIISLVPTQLQRLLLNPRALACLQRLKMIMIGGGPSWSALVESAQAAKLPVVFSYGMTETAAMGSAQIPAEFVGGDLSSGKAMPHVRIEICDEDSGTIIDADRGGLIRVTGGSVMRGYYGEAKNEGSFTTADLGRIDQLGHLHINGRRDDVIISGGENVSARAIESILRGCDSLTDVVVVGLPHLDWGEEVVACYLSDAADDETALSDWASTHLEKHQCPKRFLRLHAADWPRNDQGKVNRTELRRLAIEKAAI
jgi:O-succinylbenzoic acid--CoA ligase